MPRGSLTWAGWFASGLLLAGCAGHKPAPTASYAPSAAGHNQGYYKIGRPYQIDGTWYYPREDWSYDQTGIASWYGEAFHGKNTADGEVFDLNSLTAAHRTLPMPVVVRVTNLENGRSIKLRVNDRGPYARGRIIDVSRRAAQLLGFEGQGTAKVRVQIEVPDSMVVATAAGRAGSSPSVGGVVAAVVSAPLTLPVHAIEAMRGPPEPPRPATPVAIPQAAPVMVADRSPVVAQQLAPSPRPAPVRVADNAPMAAAPRQAPSPQFQPAPPPNHSARADGDRPYIIDELPGDTAATAQPVAARQPMPTHVQIAAVRPTQIYVQAGAFADQGNARRLESRLRGLGSPINVIPGTNHTGAAVFRVRLGPVASVDAADELLGRVVANGIMQARIVVD